MGLFKIFSKAAKKADETQVSAAEEKTATAPASAPVAVKPKRDEEDEALWQRYILIEPTVREILLAKYDLKLPPGLFDESQPERERRKKGFREAFNEYGGDVDNLDMENKDDVNETAGDIANAIKEFISEEALNPFSEDEWA
jgi:hypothetical protein